MRLTSKSASTWLGSSFCSSPSRDQAGTLYHPASGRRLTIETQAPCLVIYSANCVDDSVQFDGQPMIQHNGLALKPRPCRMPFTAASSQMSFSRPVRFYQKRRYFVDVTAPFIKKQSRKLDRKTAVPPSAVFLYPVFSDYVFSS